MDPKTLKELALAETGRFFLKKFGTTPSEDSEEWEDEYRRQFNLLKNGAARTTTAAPAAPPVAAEEPSDDLPELSGTPADKRWASALRAARLKAIQSKEMRAWLARTRLKAKDWIDSRELSDEEFAHRAEPQFAAARRQSTADTAALAATRNAQAATEAALQQEIVAAGISAAGLLGLIDVSPRAAALPIKDKLAEVRLESRTVRIFATADPAILMVLERHGDQKSEYGIERDSGLVADLKLFARSSP
jgi:hypothetical protein